MTQTKRPAHPELREYVNGLYQQFGPVGAAQRLGVGRSVVLSELAGIPMLRGSLLLLERGRERLEAQDGEGPEAA